MKHKRKLRVFLLILGAVIVSIIVLGITLHDSEKAVAGAQSNIKHIQAKNWTGGTHSLPMDFPHEINAEIVAFIAANDSKD